MHCTIILVIFYYILCTLLLSAHNQYLHTAYTTNVKTSLPHCAHYTTTRYAHYTTTMYTLCYHPVYTTLPPSAHYTITMCTLHHHPVKTMYIFRPYLSSCEHIPNDSHHCTALLCTTLYSTALYYNSTPLQRTVVYCTSLQYTALQVIVYTSQWQEWSLTDCQWILWKEAGCSSKIM